MHDEYKKKTRGALLYNNDLLNFHEFFLLGCKGKRLVR